MNGPPTGGSPESDLVSAQLRVILASDAFAGAWRQRRLLEYLVAKSVEGRTGDLKEYCVGVEVFEKGPDFDPRLSPIVRVEVSRLRRRLQQYYETQGRDDRVRIELPKGSYVPRIVPTESLPQEPAATVEMPAAQPGRARFWRWPLWIAAGLAGALGLLIAGRFTPDALRPADRAAYSFSRITHEQAPCSGPALSPDGRLLAYARKDSGDFDIYLRVVGSEESRNLTPDSRSDDWQPSFSPDGRHIAFRSELNGGGIWVMATSGGDLRRLADFGFHPSWSPDGKQILISDKSFDHPEDGPRRRAGALFSVEIDSGAVRRLTGDAVYDAVQPVWSPRRQRIAYWGSDDNGNRDLWTVAPGETARPVPVTRDASVDWNPRWSADGRHLYFLSDRDGAMNVWRIRVDEGSGEVSGTPEAVRTPSSYTADISLSAGGKRIVYTNRQISTRIYKVPVDLGAGVDRSAAVALTRPGERFREPALSPDGAWLALRIQDPQEDIGLVRPDGSELRRLTNDQFKDRAPQWSPDGRQLVFLSNRGGSFETWAIQPDGSGLRRLSPTMRMVWWPDGSLVGFPREGPPFVMEPAGRQFDARPLPEGFIPESWSPDGRHVIGRGPAPLGQPAQPVVYSVERGESWKFAANMVCPIWLRDSSAFLFSENGAIRIADVRQRTSRVLLSVPGNVLHERFALSGEQKFVYYALSEIADSIWMAERR